MSTFEFFFKYPPIIYQKGKLAFQLLNSRWWFLLAVLAAIGAAVYFYRNIPAEKRSPGMIALRALTFIILAFIALQPVLNVSTVLPQDSYLAVVIDNSESMKIRDDGKTSRGEQLLAQMESTGFLKRLGEKFKTRLYMFDRDAQRIEDMGRLTFDGKRTRLESATDLLQQELGTVPLSGVVLITDGVDNASQQLADSIARLETRRIPFYTVGVGSDEITRDAEVVKVVSPREMLKESTAVVDVQFRSYGFSGRKAVLSIEENGKRVKAEEVTLPADGEIGEKTIDLPVKNEGSRLFSFSIEVPDDRIPENNALGSLITVRDDHPKILHVDGEPRWDYKFLRRAASDDPNIRLVSFLRTSQNKFYRQGLEDEKTLQEGFPKTKEELYEYKALILGSIESTFFSQDQLNMIVDFVSNRGGGFLMTGGRNSFAAGRYQNTPIAEMLPVQLGADRSAPILDTVRLLVSDYGKTHNLMRLSADASANVKQWSDLPPLQDFNKTLEAKVGGIVLATGHAENNQGAPTLMAYQRYGRGRVMVFASGTSWRWQMLMDSKDMSYEVFWKQVLRWLVSSSPDQVTVSSDKDTYLPGEMVRIDAEVADKTFTRMNNAQVVARITDPSGATEIVPLDWTGSQDGVYRTERNAGGEGVYQIEVEASQGGQVLGSYRSAFQVQDRPVEFYNAALDVGALQSIAQETGGKYYALSDLGDIPDEAVYVEGESSIVEQKELWDVPALFMMLCVALASEWFWRKKKGLA